MKPSKYNL